MHYHAHIYWSNDTERSLAISMREHLSSLGCGLGRIMDQPIGPHPKPMYQVNYNSSNSIEVEKFLQNYNLNVLLHEDTGDDLHDHTDGARWIGEPLPLDIEWLKRYVEGRKTI